MTETFGWIIAATGAVAALVTWVKWVKPWFKRARQTGGVIVATLAGTDEVRHKITGEVLVPAQPSVGVQVANLTVAVSALAEHQLHTERLEGRIDVLEADVAELKEGREERLANRADSTAAWGAMDTAMKHSPDQD